MSIHSRVSIAVGVTTLVGLAVRWYYSSESTSGRSTLPTTQVPGQASVHPPVTARGGHAFSVQGAATGPTDAVQVPNSVQVGTEQAIAMALPAAPAVQLAPQLQFVQLQQPVSLLAAVAGPALPAAVQISNAVHSGAGQAIAQLLAAPAALQPAPQLQYGGRSSLRDTTASLLAKMKLYPTTATITMSLVWEPQPTVDIANNTCTGQLQNHTALDVEATIEEPSHQTTISWHSRSLEKLGDGFQKLKNADVNTQRLCRNLTVELPISKQLSDGRLSPADIKRIQPYCLPDVQHLKWRSLSSQLPLIFGDNNSLTTLTLHCNLSAKVCAYILNNLPADLKELEVSNIEVLNDDEDERKDDDIHLTKNVKGVNIVSLNKLTMTTAFHPADVLNIFHFPALIEFTVHPNQLLKPVYRGDFSSIPWDNIPDSNVTEKRQGFMQQLSSVGRWVLNPDAL